jgi:hypothetical protein
MLKPNFQSGQLVYDKRGNSAVYEREVHGGHMVYPETSLDEEGNVCFMLGRVKWPEVFASPPAESWWPAAILVVLILGAVVLGALS